MKKQLKLMIVLIIFSAIAFTAYKSSGQDKVYKIGDRGPAGGWIFYDKGSFSDGWRYLEAAPENQGKAEWGCEGTSIPGSKGIDIGTGKSNTQAIINGCGEAGIAAKICTAYNGGGKTDWFLPSKDELNLIYINLKKNGVGGLVGGYYSSSEHNNDIAWDQDFVYGEQNAYPKHLKLPVRAVRAF